MSNDIKNLILSVIIGIHLFLSGCVGVKGYLEKGKFTEAEKYANGQKGDNQIKSFLSIADAYMAKMDYTKAGEYYEKAGAKEGLKKIADIFITKKVYEKAIDLYKKAGENGAIIYNKVANDFLKDKKYDKAAEYFEKAGNNKGINNIAEIYLSTYDYEKAAKLYLKTGEPEIAVYNKVANDALSHNKINDAAFYFEKSGNKVELKKIADNYFEKKDYTNAAIYYDKTNSKDGLNKVADICFTDKKYEKAVENYEKAGNNEGLKKIADIMLNAKSYYYATLYYKKAGIKEDEINRNIADSYFLNEEYYNAISLYKILNDHNKIELCNKALLNNPRPKGGNWYGDNITIYISQNGKKVDYLKFETSDFDFDSKNYWVNPYNSADKPETVLIKNNKFNYERSTSDPYMKIQSLKVNCVFTSPTKAKVLVYARVNLTSKTKTSYENIYTTTKKVINKSFEVMLKE